MKGNPGAAAPRGAFTGSAVRAGRRARRGLLLMLVVLSVGSASSCSTTQPHAKAANTGSPGASAVSLSATPGAGCGSAHRQQGVASPPGNAVVLGPAWIPGALSWEHATPITAPRTPLGHGWHFLKAGVTLPAHRSIRLTVGPASNVRLVLGESLHRRITYVACADHASWWVGGLALRGRAACAVISYRTDAGETGRRTLALFRTCPS